MKISYNWLQDLIKEKLPKPEKLVDLLTMHSFETEIIGKERNDYVLEVDVLPNRAHDCFSHQGIARELAAILGYKINLIDYGGQIKKTDKSIADYLSVEVKDRNLCLRYTARMIMNVSVKPSPKWMQNRLLICGLRPINNVVDITNYVMLETGQPLHAFDADKLSKNKFGKSKIIVRRAQKGEKITTLDNEQYNLDENVLLIADEEKSLCIAGIKGGMGPEIDDNTNNIILEAANFAPTFIRRASQELKLKTDASLRFEHGLDPNLTKEAIDMAATFINDVANGEIAEGIADTYPKKNNPRKIKLSIEETNKLLGVNLSVKDIVNILKQLGFDVSAENKNNLMATIPTRRIDILMPEDLIEEIGRMYGYENIPSRFPRVALVPPIINEDVICQNKVRDILCGFGFNEVYNYSFIGENDLQLYNNKLNLIEVANPISRDQKYLRPDLLINLIKNIKDNKKYFNEIKLFEIGRIFFGNNSALNEIKKLGAIISLDAKDGKAAHNFYTLKGVVDSLLNKLRISDQWYDDELSPDTLVPDLYHPIRRAEIKVGDDCLGWIGEFDQSITSKLGIKSEAAGFEIFFDKLVELATEERIYLPPSKYPAMVRDISVLVDRNVRVAEIENLINAAGGVLIRDVDLFDIYEDEESAEGQKSIAFHIIYQSDDHNLTDKEVNAVHEKIIKALEDEGGWEVRK